MKGMVLNLRRQLPAVPEAQDTSRLEHDFFVFKWWHWVSGIAKLPGEWKTLHTQVLPVRSLIALHIKQRISIVDEISPIGTVGNILSLAVSGYEEAMSCSHWSRKTRKTLWTIWARRTGVSTLTWDPNTVIFYRRKEIVFVLSPMLRAILALTCSFTHQADQQVQCLPFCQAGQQNREDPPSLDSQVHLVGLSAGREKGSFKKWPGSDVLPVGLLRTGWNRCICVHNWN